MSNPPEPSARSAAAVFTTTSSPTAQAPTRATSATAGRRAPSTSTATRCSGASPGPASTTVPRRSVSIDRETMRVEQTRVSSLELFFDLVFVFTITQLTTVLIAHPNGRGLAVACIKLALIWWMYAGYSWLTNQIDVGDVAHRAFLLAGMAGWLILALALPTAFGSTGFRFGIAYLMIALAHAGLFTHAQSKVRARSFLLVARSNLLFAAAILVGGAIGGTLQWVVWTAAAVGLW